MQQSPGATQVHSAGIPKVSDAIALSLQPILDAATPAGTRQKPEDRPDTPHPDRKHYAAQRTLCAHLDGGTHVIHAHKDAYLPKHEAEQQHDYEKRAEFTEVYEGYGTTLDRMSALVFQKSPVLGDNVPQQIRDHYEALSRDRKHGDLFMRDAFRGALRAGFRAFLIDYPAVPENQRGQGIRYDQQKQRKLRPYWSDIPDDDIITWRVGERAGEEFYTLIVLRERKAVEDGLFGTAFAEQFRVYRHDLTLVDATTGKNARGAITCAIWAEREDPLTRVKVMQEIEAPVPIVGPSRIPVVFYQLGEACGRVVAKPPLLSLAVLNLAHYRVSSDRRWLMHLCCVPVPWARNLSNRNKLDGTTPQFIFGPNVLVELGEQGAFGWAEPTGSAFGPTKDECDELKNQMASVSLAILQRDKRMAETEAAQRLNNAASNASLADFSRRFEDAVESGLVLHAEFMGVELTVNTTQSGGSFTLNREYETTVLSDATLTLLSAMEEKRQITLEMLWDLMEKGEILPKGFERKQAKAQLALMADAANADGAPDSPYAPAPNAPPHRKAA